MKLAPKFGNTYMGLKNASIYNFRQENCAKVSFLDSFLNSATFLLANEKVILRSLSTPKFKRWTVVDDLMKQIFSYEGE